MGETWWEWRRDRALSTHALPSAPAPHGPSEDPGSAHLPLVPCGSFTLFPRPEISPLELTFCSVARFRTPNTDAMEWPPFLRASWWPPDEGWSLTSSLLSPACTTPPCAPPLATWSHPFFSPSGAHLGPLFLSVILLSPRTAALLFPLLNLLCPAPVPPTAPLLWRTYGLSKEHINCILPWASLSFCPRWQQSLHHMDWGGSLLSSEGTRLHTHREHGGGLQMLVKWRGGGDGRDNEWLHNVICRYQENWESQFGDWSQMRLTSQPLSLTLPMFPVAWHHCSGWTMDLPWNSLHTLAR